MTKIALLYKGDLQVECIHESGALIETSAPKDNGGKGDRFSPTDLFAASLVSCMLTVMALAAKKLHVDLSGMSGEVEKEMVSIPTRRIGRLIVRIKVPRSFSHDVVKKLEEAALKCPVHASLHPEIALDFDFVWG